MVYAPPSEAVSIIVAAAMVAFARGDIAMTRPLRWPRRCGSVSARARGMAAEYCPPRKNPAAKRNARRAATAHVEVCSGSVTMRPVHTLRPSSAPRDTRARPRRSARVPRMNAPRGRPRSVAAKTRPSGIVELVDSTPPSAMTGRKMSNWSTKFPTRALRRASRRSGVAAAGVRRGASSWAGEGAGVRVARIEHSLRRHEPHQVGRSAWRCPLSPRLGLPCDGLSMPQSTRLRGRVSRRSAGLVGRP